MLNISRENDLTHITQLNEQHLLKTEQLNYSIKTTPTEILTIRIRWRITEDTVHHQSQI